jgi:hypothetical protein
MINRRRVDQASRMAARWLVTSAQSQDPGTPEFGGFATGYDHERLSFVVGPECWHTAEAIRSLLKVHARTRNQAWKDAAVRGGDYLASLQSMGQDSEEAGSLWGPWLGGHEELRVDSNYRCILGLLDLYGATGSARYLEVSGGIVGWFLERVYKGGGTHLNRYLPEKKTLGWPRSHILDEGSFLALFDLTREERYATVHREQAEALIAAAGDNGTFSCMDAPRMERDPGLEAGEISTRNLYWHVMPLLARQAKNADGRTLEVVERVGSLLASWQDEDGYLLRSYGKERGKGPGEPDGVATAMFALVCLKLREITGADEHLQSAERALAWILESQSTARREEVFGSFYQERTSRDGRPRVLPGSLGSSYGIMACEEYLRSVASE